MSRELSVFVAFLVLAVSSVSLATLGELASSTRKDSQILSGALKVRSSSQYSVHEISANGNLIKEYISPDGHVFAVSWQGISHPDLKQLLGSYYSEYHSTRMKGDTHRRKGPELVQTSRAIVKREGHMRDVRGRAFDPALVPAGVNVEALP